jgi:hypothetical protein
MAKWTSVSQDKNKNICRFKLCHSENPVRLSWKYVQLIHDKYSDNLFGSSFDLLHVEWEWIKHHPSIRIWKNQIVASGFLDIVVLFEWTRNFQSMWPYNSPFSHIRVVN